MHPDDLQGWHIDPATGLLLPRKQIQPRWMRDTGPWHIERPANDPTNSLVNQMIIWDAFTLLDPLMDTRAVINGITDSPYDEREARVDRYVDSYIKVVRRVWALGGVKQPLFRSAIEAECLGKLIWGAVKLVTGW